jgi:hypothetical protein
MIGGTASNRTKLILVACMVLLMILYGWWSSGYVNKQAKADKDHFNTADIHGIFVKRETRHHTVAFQVDNLPDWFVFWPKTRVGFSSDDFEYFVRPGDSIIKRVNADTLYLIRGDRIYHYTFEKVND